MSIKNVANIGWTYFVFDFIQGAYILQASVLQCWQLGPLE